MVTVALAELGAFSKASGLSREQNRQVKEGVLPRPTGDKALDRRIFAAYSGRRAAEAFAGQRMGEQNAKEWHEAHRKSTTRGGFLHVLADAEEEPGLQGRLRESADAYKSAGASALNNAESSWNFEDRMGREGRYMVSQGKKYRAQGRRIAARQKRIGQIKGLLRFGKDEYYLEMPYFPHTSAFYSADEVGKAFRPRQAGAAARAAAPKVRAGAKRAKARWDKLPGPARAAIGYGVPLAIAAGTVYTQGSRSGSAIPSGGASKQAEKTLSQFQAMAASRAKDRRYKPIGENVFHRGRKVFRGSAAAGAAQMVESNKGGDPIYLRTRYPHPLRAGVTYPANRTTGTAVDLRPGIVPTRASKATARYFAAHEHEHARTMDAASSRKMVAGAASEAMSKVPKKHGAVREFLTGAGIKRQAAYGEALSRRVGEGEALADLAAHRTTGIDPRIASGYPRIAASSPEGFGAGYHAKGGPKVAGTPALAHAERKALKQAWKKGLKGALRARL